MPSRRPTGGHRTIGSFCTVGSKKTCHQVAFKGKNKVWEFLPFQRIKCNSVFQIVDTQYRGTMIKDTILGDKSWVMVPISPFICLSIGKSVLKITQGCRSYPPDNLRASTAAIRKNPPRPQSRSADEIHEARGWGGGGSMVNPLLCY